MTEIRLESLRYGVTIGRYLSVYGWIHPEQEQMRSNESQRRTKRPWIDVSLKCPLLCRLLNSGYSSIFLSLSLER